MKSEKTILENLSSYLWQPNKEEEEIVNNLPEEFKIDVPYYVAEKMHWSGPACGQMFFEFHGRPVPSQEEIAEEMGIQTWKHMNHESLEEDFIRFMAKRNFVPGIYFPALKLRPHFEISEEMGDFMYKNAEDIAGYDWSFFKAMLVKDKSPVFIRIHFTTDDYNMSEEMAEILDNVGHGVMIVGYNTEGFIIHDPWNKDKWGGNKGGANTLLTYEQMMGPNLPVNSTKDFMLTLNPLKACFRIPNHIPFPEKDIEITLKVKNCGLNGIQGDYYKLKDIQGILRSERNLVISEGVSIASSSELLPGGETEISWKFNTGSKIGSVPLSAKIQATLELPCRPWERNNLKSETVTISTEAKIRIDVKNPEWFPLYGKL